MIFKSEQQKITEVEPLLKKSTKKRQKPKGSRWTIVILFALTLVIAAIFYLKTELPILWQKISSPLVITGGRSENSFNPEPILSGVKNLTKQMRGDYGFYVYRFSDQNEYGLNQKEIFPAASLMKLPVMLLFYQEVEKGNLNPQTKYVLKENDKVLGAGILQGKSAGSTYTYRQLVEYMGRYSDNTAFKVMRRILGDQNIQQAIDDLGMTQTSLKDFTTTPEDIGKFFQKIYQGEVINNEHKEELLNFLTKTAYEDWLPKEIPQEIKVAHKIGKDLGTFSDGGIVFAERPYIIVIMSKDARETEANEILPKISSLVWEWEKSLTSL